MKKVILGTAGHIDHGKTTLMKALTGVDLDRLKEEKERGITIELGFTSLTLPGGQVIGIIDVPGHERFIKNMVAGVGGIDMVLMVIAADEGVMPQTREHLDICQLLAIKKGLIALTKSDLVDDEWLALVQEDIRRAVQGTFLEQAPIIPLSSTTGKGIPDLLAAIDTTVAAVRERPSSGMVRLPIDRVFTMKGFGTVITGTLLAGAVSVGDEVEILPSSVRAKVRGIQVHNESVSSVAAGVRTAINVQGIEKSQIERGEVLTTPGTMLPTRRVDAWVEYLATAPRPLKDRTRIRFHSGTAEVMGEALVLGGTELLPGQGGFIQLVFETPLVLLPHDRYVIRSYSPVHTLGGGEILDNLARRHKKNSDATTTRLPALKNGTIRDALEIICGEAGLRGLAASVMQARLGLEPSRQQLLITELSASGKIVVVAKDPLEIAAPRIIQELEQLMLKELADFHKKHPLKIGMLREEIRARMPYATSARLFSFALDKLLNARRVVLSKEHLSLAGSSPTLQDAQKDLQKKIHTCYEKAGLMPPTLKELLEQLRIAEKEAVNLLGLLVREGQLTKVSEELYFDSRAITKLTADVVSYLNKNNEITTQGFKDLTGLSRKFMIPLFEYLDKAKVTVRVGDKRVLRKASVKL
jgi:selenocysteine-specific elongation factor